MGVPRFGGLRAETSRRGSTGASCRESPGPHGKSDASAPPTSQITGGRRGHGDYKASLGTVVGSTVFEPDGARTPLAAGLWAVPSAEGGDGSVGREASLTAFPCFQGELNGQKGLVPSNFLEEVPDDVEVYLSDAPSHRAQDMPARSKAKRVSSAPGAPSVPATHALIVFVIFTSWAESIHPESALHPSMGVVPKNAYF